MMTTMFWGAGKGPMSNALANPPERESGVPRPRRVWPWRKIGLGLGLLGVLGATVLVWVGDEVGGMVREAGRQLVGGGGLLWSDENHGWTSIPLSYRVRRHWGEADVLIEPVWKSVLPGLELAHLSFLHPPDPREVELVLVRVAPEGWRFRVYGRDDWGRGSVSALAAEAGLVFAVNGPYFAADGPLGLVVQNRVIRNRQGTLRAAHFLVDEPGSRVRIVNERRAAVGGIREGFQGFPSIMAAGKTFSYLRSGGRGFDVDAVDRRTAACVDVSGSVIFMVTDTWTGGLSLNELATAQGLLGCVDGMAFDGGASTGLWLSAGGVEISVGGLDAVPVIVGVMPG